MSRFKTLSSEILHNNPWWEMRHDKYSLPDGAPGDYFYGQSKGLALVIPILENGQLLLISQYRYLADKPSLEFPCGGLMGEETPLEAALRELKEETGFTADELIKVGVFEPLPGLFKDQAHVFIAPGAVKVSEPHLEKVEIVETVLRRINEFDDLVKRGEVWDGVSLAAWTLAREAVYKLAKENLSTTAI